MESAYSGSLSRWKAAQDSEKRKGFKVRTHFVMPVCLPNASVRENGIGIPDPVAMLREKKSSSREQPKKQQESSL